MSGYQYILLDRDSEQHIATLTLNRPDRRNALNDVMQDEIGDAIEEVEADKSIRVMVITGSGRVFCAGGDLDQLQGGSQSGGMDIRQHRRDPAGLPAHSALYAGVAANGKTRYWHA